MEFDFCHVDSSLLNLRSGRSCAMLPACVTQAQEAGKETMLGANLLRIKQFGKQVIMRAL